MRRLRDHERAREEPERARSHDDREVSGPLLGVLALQRAAGNHAVSSLLAREPDTAAPKGKDRPAKAPVTGRRVVFPGVGTIPVESFQFGSGGPLGRPRGEGRGEGEKEDTSGEVTLTSVMGDHSADLLKASLEGRVADVEVILPGGSTTMIIKLKGAMVSSYSTGGGASQSEAWTLNFQSIEFATEGEPEK